MRIDDRIQTGYSEYFVCAKPPEIMTSTISSTSFYYAVDIV